MKWVLGCCGSPKAVRDRTSLAIVLLVVALGACSPQPDSQNSTKLAAIQIQLQQIQSRLAQLENNKSSGDWVLWYSAEDPRNTLAGIYTTAQSAYPTKESCLAASGWSLPGGKVIGMDPYTIQSTTVRLTMRCLPQGIKPIGAH